MFLKNTKNRVEDSIIGFLKGGAIGAKCADSKDITHEKVQNAVSSNDLKTSTETEVAVALMNCLAKSAG